LGAVVDARGLAATATQRHAIQSSFASKFLTPNRTPSFAQSIALREWQLTGDQIGPAGVGTWPECAADFGWRRRATIRHDWHID
jgi:hypothetical protein